jgi:2-C-methyl-D-erythritol 4-phosphate cytidylyltransferase
VIVALAPHDRWFETLTVATDPRVLRVEGEASVPSPCSMHCTQKGSGHWCMTPPGPV